MSKQKSPDNKIPENKSGAFVATIAAAIAAHFLVSFVSGQAAKSTSAAASFASDQQDLRVLPFDQQNRPKLDIAFCIDTTSSMQGEIDTVKEKVKSMVLKLSSDKNRPLVRVGLVAYRDEGDDYVSKLIPFTQNIDEMVDQISSLQAEGGGDGPEAVEQGLYAAVHHLDWRQGRKTARLLYLIGDAPAHEEKADELTRLALQASKKGICIHTIGCDGLESTGSGGLASFKQIASSTNGEYQPLSYHQEIADQSGRRSMLITSAGKSYMLSSTKADDLKKAETLLSSSSFATNTSMLNSVSGLSACNSSAPMLQGATCGTIGPAGSDATVIMGVNTAGTVRCNNNLEDTLLGKASEALSKLMK